ncbi:Uu.00g138850.m01.CDS01 [Anthostomella pinea]|uniref:Uu.00g138850.m01.CDS01 n=1 Tax=Anthostomella pinea TaxID=933095 RepID=A0AAI8VQF3_9PEZI|nr:Uu.00g138850.m01.CDS01 [Anthostomella pinea]
MFPMTTAESDFDHGVAEEGQKLSDDVFWNVAKDNLVDARYAFALAIGSRSLWVNLENEVYRTDVLRAKRYTEDNTSVKHEFMLRCERIYRSWAGDFDPDGGSFPDEEGWAHPWIQDSDDETIQSPTERLPPPNNQTILQLAAVYGMTSTATKVVEVAKHVSMEYLDLQNPINLHGSVHLAAMYGHTEILRFLKDSGCDMQAVSGYPCMAMRHLRNVLQHINPDIVYIHDGLYLFDPRRPFALNALGLAILRGHVQPARFLVELYGDSKVGSLDDDYDTESEDLEESVKAERLGNNDQEDGGAEGGV